MRKPLILSLALASLVLAGSFVTESDIQAAGVLGAGTHCVAWKTKKTLGLVKRVEPVGKSCQATVKAVKQGGKLGAEMSVPIRSFSSGDKDRDKEVPKILKANVQPNIEFKTALLSEAEWKKMLSAGSGTVKGTLKVGGKSVAMNVNAKLRKGGNKEVYGQITTKFTTLGIKPPEVGPGGSIAKVDDYLELHFNFVASKLQNKAVVPGL